MLALFLITALSCTSKEEAETTSPTKPSPEAPQAEVQPKQKNTAPEPRIYAGVFAKDPRLSPLDIIQRDPSTLPFLRNEIFARHGRAFKTQKYADHFAKQSWYKIDPDYSDDRLTANDQANIKLIRSFEGSGGKDKALNGGEYFYTSKSGEAQRLVFFNDEELEIVTGDDMYFNDAARYRWTALGDRWVVTWENADTWSPKNKNASLWELDHGKNSVTAQYPIKTKM